MSKNSKNKKSKIFFARLLNLSDRNTDTVNNHKNCSYCDKPFAEELCCEECIPFRITEGSAKNKKSKNILKRLLNLSDRNSNSVNNHKNCSHCDKPLTKKLWCKECDPFKIMEGWTSGNSVIDKFIKDTMCKPADYYNYYRAGINYPFLEWVPFDKFTDIKEIGEGGFAKVYSATWIDGYVDRYGYRYYKEKNKSWKRYSISQKVALKRLNGSQNMTDKYLNEVRFYYF
jgi:hypothetical protein